MKFAISILQVNALVFIALKLPSNLPNRWAKVAQYVEEAMSSGSTSVGHLKTNIGEGRKQVEFKATAELCRTVWRTITSNHPNLLRINFDDLLFTKQFELGLPPIILVPPFTQCVFCEKNISMKGSPAIATVYTEQGPQVAAVYHGFCDNHDTRWKFYHSYMHNDKEQKTHFYERNGDNVYFHITSKTVFTLKYLKDVTNNIVYSGVSFQSRAEVYNANFSEDFGRLLELDYEKCASESNATGTDSDEKPMGLNETRILECWFIWSLVNFYERNHMLKSTNLYCSYGSASHRKDIENLCETACNLISVQPNEWILHSCDVKGCREGYITVDGNEKLRRAMCAAPRSKTHLRYDLPTVVKCCTRSPLIGNKDVKASKYCEDHLHLKDTEKQSVTCDKHSSEANDHQNNSSSTPTNFPFISDQFKRGLPATDSGNEDRPNVGCKLTCNIQKYYNTTAGMLALIRPCGIVVAMTEMFTCESATQVFLFLLRTFCKPSQDMKYFQRLRYLGYDRSCDLHPYLKNQASNDSAGARILLQNVLFLVDQFHCNKHKEACCMPHDNPACKYNPKLNIFKEIHGSNTGSCEQGFFRLNKLKHVTKHLSMYKRDFFFNEINYQFNKQREKELKSRNLME